MATLGQLKAPVLPLKTAYLKALELINSHEEGCAVFMLAGDVHATGRDSPSFQNNVDRIKGGLIGVYDLGADARQVFEDIKEFYREVA
jgi:hypothetical protein